MPDLVLVVVVPVIVVVVVIIVPVEVPVEEVVVVEVVVPAVVAVVFLFDWIIYVPSTIFQLYRDVSSCVEPVLSKVKCVLLKDTVQ